VSARNTTHTYACVSCGVTFKGRELHGQVRASNAAPSGQTRLALCARCQEEEA